MSTVSSNSVSQPHSRGYSPRASPKPLFHCLKTEPLRTSLSKNRIHTSRLCRGLIQPPQYNVRKHGQLTAPAAKRVFYVTPQAEAPSRGETAQRDTSGDQISKRHDRLDRFNPPLRKLLLKFLPISNEDNPGQRIICPGKRTASWKLPEWSFRIERFVM